MSEGFVGTRPRFEEGSGLGRTRTQVHSRVCDNHSERPFLSHSRRPSRVRDTDYGIRGSPDSVGRTEREPPLRVGSLRWSPVETRLGVAVKLGCVPPRFVVPLTLCAAFPRTWALARGDLGLPPGVARRTPDGPGAETGRWNEKNKYRELSVSIRKIKDFCQRFSL